jgi:hypothetical protein
MIQQTPEDYSPAICLSRRSIRPPIARRSTAFLLASAIAGVSCMAATSTSAQAVHVVLAVAKYVALTAAFAEAVDKLAGAVAATYGTGRTITDDMACRRERSALRELVITLRDLEVEKTELHSRLERALSQMSDWLDWQQVGGRAERVSVGILEIRQQIEEHREAFDDGAAVSRAYGGLLITFDANRTCYATWRRRCRPSTGPGAAWIEGMRGGALTSSGLLRRISRCRSRPSPRRLMSLPTMPTHSAILRLPGDRRAGAQRRRV